MVTSSTGRSAAPVRVVVGVGATAGVALLLIALAAVRYATI